MRSFEVLILIYAGLILIGLVRKNLRQRWLHAIALGSVVLIGFHLVFEGYRWQMLGIYGVTLAALAVRYLPFALKRREPGFLSGIPAVIFLLVAIVAMGISTAASILLPVMAIPEPSGPFRVGTTTYFWVDESRRGVYTDDPTAPRELMVQVWYPAESVEGAHPSRWLEHPRILSPMLAFWGDLPTFILGHLNLTYSNSYEDAPVLEAAAPFPVIVYSHGWGGIRNISQDQLEMLASHGYIVFSADHTYGSLVTVFPDGRVVKYNPDALPDDIPLDDNNAAGQKLVDTYAGDVRFILDQVEALNSAEGDARFGGMIDTGTIGMFGHSTGAAAVIEACSLDTRCSAALAQDSWAKPITEDVMNAHPQIPLALVNSELWSSEDNRVRRQEVFDAFTGDRFMMEIEGTAHYDFLLVPYLSKLAYQLGLKGPLPGEKVVAINTTALRSFFDYYLRNDGPRLDTAVQAYPEVSIEFRDSSSD